MEAETGDTRDDARRPDYRNRALGLNNRRQDIPGLVLPRGLVTR